MVMYYVIEHQVFKRQSGGFCDDPDFYKITPCDDRDTAMRVIERSDTSVQYLTIPLDLEAVTELYVRDGKLSRVDNREPGKEGIYHVITKAPGFITFGKKFHTLDKVTDYLMSMHQWKGSTVYVTQEMERFPKN